MNLDEFLRDKLDRQQTTLISLYRKIGEPIFEEWAIQTLTGLTNKQLKDFARDEFSSESNQLLLQFLKSDSYQITLGVSLYKLAYRCFFDGDYQSALSALFMLENFLGLYQGMHLERERVAKKINSKVHEENKELKKHVIALLREGKFDNLSNEKAGEALTKEVALKPRTLTRYVAEYRKQLKLANEQFPGITKSISNMIRAGSPTLSDEEIAKQIELGTNILMRNTYDWW